MDAIGIRASPLNKKAAVAGYMGPHAVGVGIRSPYRRDVMRLPASSARANLALRSGCATDGLKMVRPDRSNIGIPAYSTAMREMTIDDLKHPEAREESAYLCVLRVWAAELLGRASVGEIRAWAQRGKMVVTCGHDSGADVGDSPARGVMTARWREIPLAFACDACRTADLVSQTTTPPCSSPASHTTPTHRFVTIASHQCCGCFRNHVHVLPGRWRLYLSR